MTELSDIVDKLSVPDDETIAVVHPDVANIIHKNFRLGEPAEFDKAMIETSRVPTRVMEGRYPFKDKPHEYTYSVRSTNPEDKNVRLSNMLYGIFGEIGYVDMIIQNGRPQLVGIVHMPRRILPLVEFAVGESGLEQFFNDFARETEGEKWQGYQWNLRNHKSEIKVPEELGFVKEHFFWKLEKSATDIFKQGKFLPEQVAEYADAIKSFMQRLDLRVAEYLSKVTGKEMDINPEYAKAHYAAIQSGKLKMLPG